MGCSSQHLQIVPQLSFLFSSVRLTAIRILLFACRILPTSRRLFRSSCLRHSHVFAPTLNSLVTSTHCFVVIICPRYPHASDSFWAYLNGIDAPTLAVAIGERKGHRDIVGCASSPNCKLD
ncbi:uncharacterized protein BDZ99DRAFT_467725 [Mytilinidion resinicola]|uniref:Uncharacterized protein n=1 Tax=Mytilinidion resinicola TaxID=574789 RepID=A0A6A6Y853_9PEZI|nr:uncharacterized protein BDZ99DRAFT_467725 [Mytilinidion resinicola]KAF2803997.1 hypothetical protein BDZ99DRAFT_467725 [Mytilinidion resinicola]